MQLVRKLGSHICNEGNGEESTNYFSPKVMGDYTDEVPFTGYDVDLAKECLAKSTVDLSRPFEIQVFDDTSANVAACVRADLAVLSINVEISSVDANTFFANLTGGNMQMGLTSMATDMVSVENMMSMFDPDAGYTFNVSDDLINMPKTVPTIVDDNERHEAMKELLAQMNEECPWVPLYDAPFYIVYRQKYQKKQNKKRGTLATNSHVLRAFRSNTAKGEKENLIRGSNPD